MKIKLIDTYNNYLDKVSLFEAMAPAEIKSKYYKDVPLPVFLKIAKADPRSKIVDGKLTKIGKYFKLLMSWYQKGDLKLEDLPRATQYLNLVYKHNVSINAKDVNELSDLYELISKYIISKDSDFDLILRELPKSEYTQVFNGNNWMIFEPKTERAACHLGVNTDWCTAWGEHSLDPDNKTKKNQFVNYSNDLYIIVNKENPKEKYQFHFNSDQFMDRHDRRISTVNFFLDKSKAEILGFFFRGFIEDLSYDELQIEMVRVMKLLPTNLIQEYINRNQHKFNFNELGDNIMISNCNEVFSNLVDDPKFEYVCGKSSDETIQLEFSGVKHLNEIIDDADTHETISRLDNGYYDEVYEIVVNDYNEYYSNIDDSSQLKDYVRQIVSNKFGESIFNKVDFKVVFNDVVKALEQPIIDEMYDKSNPLYQQEVTRIKNLEKSFIEIESTMQGFDINVSKFYFASYVSDQEITVIEDADHLETIVSSYYDYMLNKLDIPSVDYGVIDVWEYIEFISYDKFVELYEERYDDTNIPGYGTMCIELERLLKFISENFNTDGEFSYYEGKLEDVGKTYRVVIKRIGEDFCSTGEIEIEYIDANGYTTRGKIMASSLPDYMYNHKLFEYREKFNRNIRL